MGFGFAAKKKTKVEEPIVEVEEEESIKDLNEYLDEERDEKLNELGI